VANFDLTAAQGVFKRIQTKRLQEVTYSVDSLKNNPGFASLRGLSATPTRSTRRR
jgi:hypothetical protein